MYQYGVGQTKTMNTRVIIPTMTNKSLFLNILAMTAKQQPIKEVCERHANHDEGIRSEVSLIAGTSRLKDSAIE